MASSSKQPSEAKEVAINTTWMLASQMVRIVLQGLYFVIVTRMLGKEAFGEFVCVLALVGMFVPFSGLGFGNLIVKNVDRDRNTMKSACGNMLFMVAVTGSIILTLLLLFKPLILAESISIWVLVMVAISDIFLTKVAYAAGQAFQAVEKLKQTSIILVSLFATRTVAALLMQLFIPQPTVLTWAALYMAGSLVSALIAITIAYRSFGKPHLALSRIRSELTEGFFFSTSMSGQVINNHIDKIMIPMMSTMAANGIYGAAYRLIDVAMHPIRSLLQATYSRFFKYGQSGIHGSLKMALKIAPISAVYGALVMVAIYFIAPVVPYILGEDFSESVIALRWLSPIPFLKSLHFVASDTLSGAGLQKERTYMIFAAAILNIILNIWLIPCYSWRGAAWSSLAADGILMLGLWVIIFVHYRRTPAT